jgi:hypothetical protein
VQEIFPEKGMTVKVTHQTKFSNPEGAWIILHHIFSTDAGDFPNFLDPTFLEPAQNFFELILVVQHFLSAFRSANPTKPQILNKVFQCLSVIPAQ